MFGLFWAKQNPSSTLRENSFRPMTSPRQPHPTGGGGGVWSEAIFFFTSKIGEKKDDTLPAHLLGIKIKKNLLEGRGAWTAWTRGVQILWPIKESESSSFGLSKVVVEAFGFGKPSSFCLFKTEDYSLCLRILFFLQRHFLDQGLFANLSIQIMYFLINL